MRIPQILPRRKVEFYYVTGSQTVRDLQAENEELREKVMKAYDRANELEDALDAEMRKQGAMFEMLVSLTADMGLCLGVRHLDALPIGAVIRTDGDLAWTRIGTEAGHALWLTPTEDEALNSEEIDSMFAITMLSWVPGKKAVN